ncbi:MAG: tRNA (cytidine(34)-2'-O)-methyltransferase [Cetobacterium somerae]|uniref:Putative tRNA (cytidine(34)-2'-O)-methyltransferase n=1 Tax=Cetobacterium somerae ATCC BAA-474 TaxID=1319815 RepID=U7V829_9FUSO|nr:MULTISPECIES: tRNA (cytidine(34)-2'-O)-methyltransferase [Cetobacterium]ERT67685.1 RNA methyltransferase, TrmH family, group 2 [Cetobacterium somerae ATCC BAA-474]MBC2853787.1 tRNA (cytidine(34)-2'-O)-methyltransferase [Cetobacterium sp. 2G large]MCQ9625650.1 tRNA (cytidine(34)-2'-O)-methyltransferase [Cetobacterium somerae]WVJ00248.1 tRNA (cytidine(34)-2'-O)-methyltransferase [Cetobacterium somerae]
MNIVLMEPEIPYNTGNIGRSCVLTNTTLHLIKPLGFSLDEKQIKRSGLDYWELIDLKVWENYEELRAAYPESNFYFATTKTTQKYSDVKYNPNDFIVFGPESRGIPAEIREANKETCITIPMIKMGRSLNLSNSAAIVLYEALRQNNFDLGE